MGQFSREEVERAVAEAEASAIRSVLEERVHDAPLSAMLQEVVKMTVDRVRMELLGTSGDRRYELPLWVLAMEGFDTEPEEGTREFSKRLSDGQVLGLQWFKDGEPVGEEMVGFRFTDKQGETVPLTRVDAEICEHEGIQHDPARFSSAYEAVVSTGFSILMGQGGSKVTKEGLDETIARIRSMGQLRDEKVVTLLQEFLVNRYTFEVWS